MPPEGEQPLLKHVCVGGCCLLQVGLKVDAAPSLLVLGYTVVSIFSMISIIDLEGESRELSS